MVLNDAPQNLSPTMKLKSSERRVLLIRVAFKSLPLPPSPQIYLFYWWCLVPERAQLVRVVALPVSRGQVELVPVHVEDGAGELGVDGELAPEGLRRAAVEHVAAVFVPVDGHVAEGGGAAEVQAHTVRKNLRKFKCQWIFVDGVFDIFYLSLHAPHQQTFI